MNESRFIFVPLIWMALLVVMPLQVRGDDIAFFYALDSDYSLLAKTASQVTSPTKVGSRVIQKLTVGKHQVIAVKMGSGAVETAISAEALLARFHCDWAISVGPVGGLVDSSLLGQWYRVAGVVIYDKGTVGENGFALAKSSEISLDLVSPEKDGIAYPSPTSWSNLKSIIVASGEKFYSSDNGRANLQSLTKADAVDMNLAGLIPVCKDHKLKLTNWRIVSDHADSHASQDFRKFVDTYNGEGGKLIGEWITALPISPERPDAYDTLRKLLKE